MNNETGGAETPAVEGVQPEATVENAEATTATPETEAQAKPEGEAKNEETGQDAPAKPKKKHWAHERIDKLTAQRHEAERERDMWKSKAQAKLPDNFDELEYEDQLAVKVSHRNSQDMAEAATTRAEEYANQVYSSRVAIARDAYPDFDQVTGNPALTISTEMAAVIKDSDLGPEIAYHLGKNPNEAAMIYSLSPVAQAKELGRLEERLSAPRPQPKLAPAPVNPVGGQATGGRADPTKMSMSEYAAWRQAKN